MFNDLKSLPRKMKNVVNGSLFLNDNPRNSKSDGESTRKLILYKDFQNHSDEDKCKLMNHQSNSNNLFLLRFQME